MPVSFGLTYHENLCDKYSQIPDQVFRRWGDQILFRAPKWLTINIQDHFIVSQHVLGRKHCRQIDRQTQSLLIDTVCAFILKTAGCTHCICVCLRQLLVQSGSFHRWRITISVWQPENGNTRPADSSARCVCINRLTVYLLLDWCRRLLLHPLQYCIVYIWSIRSGYMESLTFHFLATGNYTEVQHGEWVSWRKLSHTNNFTPDIEILFKPSY